MSDSTSDLFASLVARERGLAGGLVPRLPSLFEAGPAVEDPAPPDRGAAPASTLDARPAPVSATLHERTGPVATAISATEARSVRHEVVRVEERVRVVAHEQEPRPESVGSPHPDPTTEDERVPRAVVRPLPVDEPRPRRGDDVPDETGLRPVPAPVPTPLGEPLAGPRPRDPAAWPVVVTRREAAAPRVDAEHASVTSPVTAEPVVHVSIGRLEVRAVPEPAAARPRRTPRRTESLDDYLERRNQGGRA